ATVEDILASAVATVTFADNSSAVVSLDDVNFAINEAFTATTGKYGAGIRLNSGSTLIVTGEGTLNVKGGNAAKGGKGSGASAAIGGSTSVATLTSFDGIGTADNPDGTVTVTVPLSVTGDKRFFKIVTE
ncbi:MAG: hypothetical protein J6U17_04865, partial [Kiritimatiellae bacterium]|nr:hypothetical protein [Kiritimatiellia bacterium]